MTPRRHHRTAAALTLLLTLGGALANSALIAQADDDVPLQNVITDIEGESEELEISAPLITPPLDQFEMVKKEEVIIEEAIIKEENQHDIAAQVKSEELTLLFEEYASSAITAAAPVAAPAPTPPITITRVMAGQVTTANNIYGVCIDQGNSSLVYPSWPGHIYVNVPANQYLVLNFSIPTSWPGAQAYKDWEGISTYVRIKYPPNATTSVTKKSAEAQIIATKSGSNVTALTTTILVLPQNVTAPSGTFGGTVNVVAGTSTLLELDVGIKNNGAIGGLQGWLAASTLNVVGDLHNGSTVSSTSTSTTLPMFAWTYDNHGVTAYFNNTCSNFPAAPEPADSGSPTPVIPNPTLTKEFFPALIQPEGMSTLTFTITNSADKTATGNWSFTDTLPTGLISAANPQSTIGVIVAATPNIQNTTCTGASVTAAAGAGTITVSGGHLTSSQTSCTISVDVTTTETWTKTNLAGAFIPGAIDSTTGHTFFPIDLANHLDTSVSASAAGLTGSATATLRVEIPYLKVDISPPTLTTSNGTITAKWTVTVLNATNLASDGEFVSDANKALPINNAKITATGGTGISNLAWQTPPGGTVSGTVWTLPTLAAGQAMQTTFTGQVNLAQLVSSTADANSTSLSAVGGNSGLLTASVTGDVAGVPLPPAVLQNPLPNELANNPQLDNYWQTWANAHGISVSNFDLTRIASVENDSDRWDSVSTPLAPAAITITGSADTSVKHGVGPVTYQLNVTNNEATTLNSVLISDPAFTSLTCTWPGATHPQVYQALIPTLSPGDSVPCTAVYQITDADLRNRLTPPDIVEGVWLEPHDEHSVAVYYLHTTTTVTAVPGYPNPVSTQNPNPAAWLYPSLSVRNSLTLAVPVLDATDMTMPVTLPMTGGPGGQAVANQAARLLGSAMLCAAATLVASQRRRQPTTDPKDQPINN